jgi:hypothetical protein
LVLPPAKAIAGVPAIMPQDQEPNREAMIAIEKVIGKILKPNASEVINLKVKSRRILDRLCGCHLHLIEEAIGESGTSFGLVVIERLAKVFLNELVVDDLHRSTT